MASDPRIVQATDLHLVADPRGEVMEVRTTETAGRVFGAIRGVSPQPDLVVLTGDLAHDGEEVTYRRILEMAGSLPCPVRYVPGNHDIRRTFRSVLLGESMPDDSPVDGTFDLGELRIILLDTTVPDHEGGHLDEDQLGWLREEISVSKPKILFLHHHPVEIGSPWMDLMLVANASDLFDILLPARESILGILFGHVHQDFETVWEGVPVVGTRSTSRLFAPRTVVPAHSDDPPGFRIIDVRGGEIQTRVVPVP